MRRNNRGYMVKPCVADQVRLGHLVKDTGASEGEAIASLIHSFFARKGVKNLSRSTLSGCRVSCARRV
jgi:hypothetical protein